MHHPYLLLLPLLLLLTLPTKSTALYIIHPTSLVQLPPLTTNFSTTNSYYVECERLPSQPGLSPTHCLDAMPLICSDLSTLTPETVRTERWIWRLRPGCALGYFLPREYQSAEGLPSREECEREIFGEIIRQCAFRSQYNVGSINVETLPLGPGQPGLPLTSGYPRYAMAPMNL